MGRLPRRPAQDRPGAHLRRAGRAADLSGLPPTFIDVGSAEVFRDEDIAYASQIWADGGNCELHVWPGGFHAFDMAAPDAKLAQAMMEARKKWLMRTLGGGKRTWDAAADGSH